MFAVFVACLLCVLPVSRSAPLSCEDLLRPLDQAVPHHSEGRWALIGVSTTSPEADEASKRRDSVAVDFHNSSFIQSNMVGGVCSYFPRNVSVDGGVLKIQVEGFNVTLTFFTSSCPDCSLFTLLMDSPTYKINSLNLLSRRRGLEQREVEEFRAQVECLNLPPPVIMDSSKELCPPQTEKTEDQSLKEA